MKRERLRVDLESGFEKVDRGRRGHEPHRLEDDGRDCAVVRVTRGPVTRVEREDEVGRLCPNETRDPPGDLLGSPGFDGPRRRHHSAAVRQREEDCVSAEVLRRGAGLPARTVARSGRQPSRAATASLTGAQAASRPVLGHSGPTDTTPRPSTTLKWNAKSRYVGT